MVKKYLVWTCLLSLLPLSTSQAIRLDCQPNENSELPVDVKIVIPAFLAFQVGSAHAVPEVAFELDSPVLGDAGYTYDNVNPTQITGSDVSQGVNASIRANCGQVQLSFVVSDSAGLSNGQGHYLAFDTISTTSSDPEFVPPALNNQSNGDRLVATTSYGSVTERSATWNYQFSSMSLPSSGTYQGTVTYQVTCL